MKVVLLLVDQISRRHRDTMPRCIPFPPFGHVKQAFAGRPPPISILGIEALRSVWGDRYDRGLAKHGLSQNSPGDGSERQTMMGVSEGKP